MPAQVPQIVYDSKSAERIMVAYVPGCTTGDTVDMSPWLRRVTAATYVGPTLATPAGGALNVANPATVNINATGVANDDVFILVCGPSI